MESSHSIPVVAMVASALAGTISCGGVQHGGPTANEGGGARERIVGAWRLASLEEPGADGAVHRADASGLLVFTGDGHMSVQVMYRHVQAEATEGSSPYAQGGYEASFGTYVIDERARTFTFHVEGALVRTLVGKDLPRIFELAGKQLVVTSSNPNEHWRVVWER